MEQTTEKKRILSCIQSSGTPTLGNYLGALKNWRDMAGDFDCAFAVADLHAITVRQDPKDLRHNTAAMFALLMAIGLDPDKTLLFVQSQVPQHAQLAWILTCYTQFGELSRMTQYKDKAAAHADNINAGLFTYPCLMAADILLYNAHYVPVGADQKQHMELTRDVAVRFNGLYGDVFTVPEPYILKTGAKVMSLQDPARKMSKSDTNQNAFVSLLDPPDVIMKKFRRAVTDSEARVYFDDSPGSVKDGINNLMGIYSCVTGRSYDEIEAEFEGKGYGDFKTAGGEAVAAELLPIQDRFKSLMEDRTHLEDMMRSGAEKASRVAGRTLGRVMKKVGFLV